MYIPRWRQLAESTAHVAVRGALKTRPLYRRMFARNKYISIDDLGTLIARLRTDRKTEWSSCQIIIIIVMHLLRAIHPG